MLARAAATGLRAGQLIARRDRRRESSSSGASSTEPPSARSIGKSRIEPLISRIAPLTAMPNTPCPPWSRSTTSSGYVHS